MATKYTKEILADAVIGCKSWADVCRKLSVQPFTGAQTHLKKQAKKFDVDFSHFTGMGWNKGLSLEKKDIQIYLNNEAYIHSAKLRQRLIKEGYKEAKCEGCGLTEWMGEPIELELDHLNSDHFDNRLDNLWIACPNCHALETRKRRAQNCKTKAVKVKTQSQGKFCGDCGNSVYRESKVCKNCSKKYVRYKINWPSNEELSKMIRGSCITKVAKKLGVSHTSVRRKLNGHVVKSAKALRLERRDSVGSSPTLPTNL